MEQITEQEMRERLNKLIESEAPGSKPSYAEIINELQELCGTNVLKGYETDNNGRLIVYSQEPKMKEILAATGLFPQFKDINAADIKFTTFSRLNNAIKSGWEVELKYHRQNGADITSSEASSFSHRYRKSIPKIKEIFTDLQEKHTHLEKELNAYYENVSRVLADPEHSYRPSTSDKMQNYIKAVSAKYSTLSKEDQHLKAKELVKKLHNTKEQEKDFLFTIKESCKWIFNKLTFGLTEKSANQKIDELLDRAIRSLTPQKISECQYLPKQEPAAQEQQQEENKHKPSITQEIKTDNNVEYSQNNTHIVAETPSIVTQPKQPGEPGYVRERALSIKKKISSYQQQETERKQTSSSRIK